MTEWEARWKDMVYTAPSAIHGTGLFAAREFEAGETVMVRDESREVTEENPLREDLGEYEWHCDWFEGGRQVLLPYPERHVNHSCDPNTWTDFGQGAGRIIALRHIRPGEELTASYSVNLEDGKAWDCNCGSSRCLKRVPGEFFDLPLDRQTELMPYLADWFIAEHRDEYEELARKAGMT